MKQTSFLGCFSWLALAALLAACDPDPNGDAGMDASCSLVVELAAPSASGFRPYIDGDEAAVVLGFQGFQMLQLDVRVVGAGDPSSVELSAYVLVEDTGVEASRLEREALTVVDSGGVVVRGFLVFFNDAPLSEIGGHDATVEVIARARGCVGGAAVRVRLSDRAPCIDPDASVPEAGVADGGLPDGALVCGAP